MRNKKLLKILRPVGYFLFLAIIFGISLSQQPLYNSSQNGYFVQGLAKGGLGLLKEDWRANIKDPFLVFTFLVRVTYQYLHVNLFYLSSL